MTILTHIYEPRGACRTALEGSLARAGEILLSGPAGTGKSRACLEKLNAVAIKYPGMRGLIVRKTLASLGSSALVTWRRDVVPQQLNTGDVGFYGGSAEEPPQYQYSNGSRIMLGGLDKVTKIMSTEYDMIYVQEAVELTEEDWEALTTRLRNGVMPYQQLIADTNPAQPTHWLKLRCDAGRTTMLESRHEDNPRLFDELGDLTQGGTAYIARLDGLTGVRYARLRKGLWVAAEGVIYEEFDPAVHIIAPFEVPGDWTRWWAVDFGFTNPFVLQSWAEDSDGRLFLTREIYRTRRTVDQHAAQVRGLEWSRPRATICDHDAEGRAQLEKHLGISTSPAHKAVTEGIQAVQKRLREKRLFIFRDAIVERDQDLVDLHLPVCTSEEVAGYIWGDHKTKEAPVKENDHGCDAMRYMVAERDLGGRPNVRFI